MNRFDGLRHWAWSILVVTALAFTLGGCSGDDGKDGVDGTDGVDGADGTDGQPAPLPDEVQAAIDSAQAESCGTCHDGVGDQHQDIYDGYTDVSDLVMTFNNLASADNGDGTFAVTLDFSITKDGMPLTDMSPLDQQRFYLTRYDSALGQYLQGNIRLRTFVAGAVAGDWVGSQADVPFDPLVNGQVYGYIADEPLFSHEGGSSELPEGSHVHLYDNVSSAALAFGTANVADAASYESLANVEGCENCHGTPYMKHGYREAQVAELPDFASCKSCHYDDRNGNHSDWQYMVDEPFNWATGEPETADYSYLANIMNDTHMSHAMEFPYPQSISNCSTCHDGKLTQILTDEFFTGETCTSCHPVQGIDAWDGEIYAQPHRAPALLELWTAKNVESFHNAGLDCTTACHTAAGAAPTFAEYHTGYDVNISDASGNKYSDLYTVSIDQITMNGNLLTVNFSSNDVTIVPELLVSFYGWDSKQFLVSSHERDGNVACQGYRPGCKMEYTPESSGGGANPLFAEDAASVPGDWMVTLDVSVLQLTKTDDLPTLIANGDVKMAEVTVTPEMNVGGVDVVLMAAAKTFDIGGSLIVDDYFKGANATVVVEKCNACHDALASTFHSESGRGGDGIEVCKNCHTTTFAGSHLEMASRAIDSYTHAIHSFQPFDLDDVAADDDPVENARTAQHMGHVFPNFTIRNCEACHVDGTYNVPDQSKSMPGLLSASWDIADRNIGDVPEAVVGPASRACGACHRVDMINPDLAGDLASFNAHTDAFGTYEDNDDEELVIFGIIDKIMSMFE
jgi:OmcA/MtrC family decaheme c-type cytochrome